MLTVIFKCKLNKTTKNVIKNNKEDIITFLIVFDLGAFNKICILDLVSITAKLF